MIAREVRPGAIREHYDRLSLLYRVHWGPHLHHGYWSRGATPRLTAEEARAAQERLIQELAGFAGIPHSSRIVDVGCGLAGSSIWLAEHRGARVWGVSVSPVQVAICRASAAARARARTLRFLRADAGNLVKVEGLPRGLDVVWVVECMEHLADKGAFLKSCAKVLRPGGVVAIATWTQGPQGPEDGGRREELRELLRGMLCPSFGSRDDYLRWLSEAGFARIRSRRLTREVSPTWRICSRLARKRSVRLAGRLLGEDATRFLESFGKMESAYRDSTLEYDIFAARLPEG